MRRHLLPWVLPTAVALLWWSLSLAWPPLRDYLRQDHPSLAATLPDLSHMSDPWSAGGAAIRFLFSVGGLTHLATTVARTVVAFFLAGAAGGFLGWGTGSRPQIERAVLPSVEALRALPPVALLPVFILVMGLGEAFAVSFAAFGAVWPVTVAAHVAVQGVDQTTLAMARNLQLSARQVATRVVIPLALPGYLTGLRIALPLCLILVVVSELFVGGGVGLGAELDLAKRSFEFDLMMGIVIVIGCVGLALNGLLAWGERTVLWWDPRFRHSPTGTRS